MNLPTMVTTARIMLIPVFMVFLLVNIKYGALLAAAVFILAAATDGLDGYLARSRNEVTRLGILLDPLADKLLITAALVSLIQLDRVSAWVAMLILGREFAITGLRLVAAAEGMVLSASKLGKLKTISQIVAIVAVLIDFPGNQALLWLAVAITVWSGIDYFAKAAPVFQEPRGSGN
ncbi:MAG: CDP-diacylglycerol--glycerol-3-phosphate 3-phosphatidyltransferase [Firmicutes bacterium]|nr:CDP-diacylglycerol--glycerol-3-phosphate 3-phosphatidyltransferase [Bacillota bacterium]